MVLALALLLLLCSLLYLYIKFHFNYWQRRGIPHDTTSFPEGNMQGWLKTKHFVHIFRETYNKYKHSRAPYVGFYFNIQTALLVLDLELVKQVLIKDFQTFHRRGLFYNERDDPLTGNLFSLDGSKWQYLRAKLSPTFTTSKMRHMFDLVSEVGAQLSAVMTEQVGVNGCNMEVNDLMGRFTADVIGSCAFGLECNSLREPQAEFATMGRKVFSQRRHNRLVESMIFSFPELARKLRMRLIRQDVHDFYTRIVRETIELRQLHGDNRHDFMQMLMELKQEAGLTLEELTAQAFIFFVAGFDTSSTTMGYALYELALNVKVQQRLRAEITQVLAQHKQQFSFECMREMKYLEQVIAETLRKYPIAPALFRKSTAYHETSDAKYFIEPNTQIIIPVEAFHYDEHYFPNPNVFDPARFTSDAIERRPACCYLPFGDGPRNCIGMRFARMQISIGLVYLLRSFSFQLSDQTQIPIQYLKESFNLNTASGIHLRVEKL